jgi:hypothetical protein
MQRWLARELRRNDKTLVGFWPLQGNTRDYSGNAYHGLPVGGQLLLSAGNKNGYFFNTTNNYISAGSAANTGFSITSKFSFSFWLYIAKDLGGFGGVLSRIGSSGQGYDITYQNNNSNSKQITFRGINTSGATVISCVFTLGTTDTAEWMHIVIGYDGSYSRTGVKCYCNGRPVKQTSGSITGLTDMATAVGTFFIGDSTLVGHHPLGTTGHSILRCLRVYNKELLLEDALSIYGSELDMFRPRKVVTVPFPSNTLPLTITGYSSINNNLPLYTKGSLLQSQALTLFIGGYSNTSSGLPLYIRGALINNNNLPLYISGTGLNKSLPLFIQGMSPINSGIPLYIKGSHSSYSNLNLFVCCRTVPAMPLTLPLFIRGNHTGTSGMGRFIPLHIAGTAFGHGMNLFLAGSPTDISSKHMNLFIEGSKQVKTNSLPLFLSNTSSGVNNNLPLSITGSGSPPGQPIGHSLNLFIKRWPSNVFPLFIKCSTPQSSNLPMFIKGAATQSKALTLVMPHVQASGNTLVPLFISGY